MYTFAFHDINTAYTELMMKRLMASELQDTRNGKAWVFRGPVCIQFTSPWRNVLFDEKRDANPFFHYMEAIWMLAGSNDVHFPARFASNIMNYSDNGVTLHGAYGYRWIYHFYTDQIQATIQLLKNDPHTRRAVIDMWDPAVDSIQGKDLPCNTHIYFAVRNHRLDMTVCNRSNDLVWGLLGANAVHMYALHEYIANSAGIEVGSYYQFTNNLHIYEGFEEKFNLFEDTWYGRNRGSYARLAWSPSNIDLDEARLFVLGHQISGCPILTHNAMPMLEAWNSYKAKDFETALYRADQIHDEDWKRACIMWLNRRKVNYEQKETSV